MLAEVESYTPYQRLTLLANFGSFACVAAFAACWAGAEDPLGGARAARPGPAPLAHRPFPAPPCAARP